MCLPELLLRSGGGSDSILVGENAVNSDFIKQHSHSRCVSHSVYFSVLAPFSSFPFTPLLSDQVVGPPAAGAFRVRPSKPTAFRKFYERGEFPMALEHDSKGNRIAWKVGALPSGKD